MVKIVKSIPYKENTFGSINISVWNKWAIDQIFYSFSSHLPIFQDAITVKQTSALRQLHEN